MVDVDGEHGDDDGQRHKYHGEHQVLPNEGDNFGRGRDDLLDHQEEDGEGHQHGGAEWDLLPAVGRQIEDQDGEEGQANAGDDQEEGVEERQPADDEGVGDGGIGSAAVHSQATATCSRHYFPFAIVKIVTLVDIEVLQKDIHL